MYLRFCKKMYHPSAGCGRSNVSKQGVHNNLAIDRHRMQQRPVDSDNRTQEHDATKTEYACEVLPSNITGIEICLVPRGAKRRQRTQAQREHTTPQRPHKTGRSTTHMGCPTALVHNAKGHRPIGRTSRTPTPQACEWPPAWGAEGEQQQYNDPARNVQDEIRGAHPLQPKNKGSQQTPQAMTHTQTMACMSAELALRPDAGSNAPKPNLQSPPTMTGTDVVHMCYALGSCGTLEPGANGYGRNPQRADRNLRTGRMPLWMGMRPRPERASNRGTKVFPPTAPPACNDPTMSWRGPSSRQARDAERRTAAMKLECGSRRCAASPAPC